MYRMFFLRRNFESRIIYTCNLITALCVASRGKNIKNFFQNNTFSLPDLVRGGIRQNRGTHKKGPTQVTECRPWVVMEGFQIQKAASQIKSRQ